MQLWHIAALLLCGIAVGILFPGRLTEVFGAATLYAFLPALIFEGAWHLDFHVMRRAWRPIALLAIPGVVVTAAIVAISMRYIGGFAWDAALILGAILSATDPVAVVAIFRRLDVPKPLATIVESESLLNDAVAVVVYRAVVAVVLASAGIGGVWHTAGMALFGVAAGIAFGVAFAYAAAFALRERVTPWIQSIATLLGAYGVYILADSLGLSGIFAVLTFGVALREFERHRITVSSAEGVATFWHRLSTAANLALFFLIGAALDFTRLLHSLPAVGVTIAAVFVARAVISYGLLHIVREHVRRVWRTVVRMAGIRGALSLALALATPAAVAQRGALIDATFAVVVITILVGSLTLERRIARMPLRDE